jgi:glucose 1-dehydrogenase
MDGLVANIATEKPAVTKEPPLRGQWAVITGGSKGIGRAIAERFIDVGANVVLVARGSDALSEATTALGNLAVEGQQVRSMVVDIATRAGIRQLFEQLQREIPALNIFIANAGTGRFIPFLEITDEDWDENVAVNQMGAFLSCQEAARMMVAKPVDNRSILVVSSIRANGVRPNTCLYSATKAAVNQMARVAAYELAPHGIRVNVLSPGLTATPLVMENTPDVYEKARLGIPMGRPGHPDDMAAAAVYLCSPSGSFVTGANLTVDGGESLW